ncbi:hypothetical protein [Alicyclobacillus cellulosilyticus]|uniref:hypothetical protein n=1 Tax=Alicyclobacillus cellulosilyticus TaxID=1003997 RepID=UPI00166C793D|nr:hypothetical protein [Alicyclobacillus cellulosilyticus]
MEFGGPNNWEIKNGNFVKDVLTPQYVQALNFVRKLYTEGLINQDFAVIQRPDWEGNFTSGKAGAITNTSNTALTYLQRLQQTNPKWQEGVVGVLQGPKGYRIASGPGYNGILLFPKSSVKTVQQLKQILSFFEKLCDKPMANLLAYGIQGKHYTIKNGVVIRNPNADYDDEVGFPYRWPLCVVDPTHFATPAKLTPIEQQTNQVVALNNKYAVQDPTLTLVSPTYQTKGAQLNQIITDADTQYIMGKITIGQWRQKIAQWEAQGGDQIAKEYEQAWKAQHKK